MQLRPGETLLNLQTNWKIEKFVGKIDLAIRGLWV